MKKITLLLAFAMIFSFATAQTAEEIVENYYEAIGGYEALSKIKAMKVTGKISNIPNIGDLPFERFFTDDGKNIIKFSLQGTEMVQEAFDGEVAWGHNQQSLKAEKRDAETTENIKRESKNFPDAFFNWKEKGYSLELAGTETFEGVECYKVKLTSTPLVVEGQEVENVTYYLFDQETFVLLCSESEQKYGQAKGYIIQTTFSDYQEVNGIYFAFSMTQGVKGIQSMPLSIESYEINPEIDNSIFEFPKEATIEGQ